VNKILVVDDEPAIRRVLATRLSKVGYDVVVAADGQEAIEVFHHESPDLIVLDVMLPKLDGYRVCQELRKDSDVPIVMLTALGDIGDRINGLELGADDYLTKPFSPRELEVRIQGILRRLKDTPSVTTTNSSTVSIGNLTIDTDRQQVYKNSERIWLTSTEFSLLELLVRSSGHPKARAEILEELWGYPPTRRSDMRVVDVYVARLRAKLEEDPRSPELIITVRGTGYAFRRLAEPAA